MRFGDLEKWNGSCYGDMAAIKKKYETKGEGEGAAVAA